jgi:hypothetical protein
MNGDLQELTAAELRMSEVEEMDCLLDGQDIANIVWAVTVIVTVLSRS